VAVTIAGIAIATTDTAMLLLTLLKSTQANTDIDYRSL